MFGMLICIIAGFGTMGYLIAKMRDEKNIRIKPTI